MDKKNTTTKPMEKKAFEIPIKILKKAREKSRIEDPCPICQIDDAIAFLEAAQRVDRERCLNLLCPICYQGLLSIPDLRSDFRGQLRSLLEALPKGD